MMRQVLGKCGRPAVAPRVIPAEVEPGRMPFASVVGVEDADAETLDWVPYQDRPTRAQLVCAWVVFLALGAVPLVAFALMAGEALR
ncbi:MAG TPA: hypothetical protein VFU47_03895 [Armatimonadota bacterium]|nr:hypothetical protein [Armatimonadota bacterium]